MAAAVVALLVAPVATATWRAYGSSEPDNALDSPLFMYFDPPPPGSQRVYFNAYVTYVVNGANGGTFNPNVGALNSNMEGGGTEHHEAILGIWVDCNGDGYVGMAETAVREYANELLLDKTVCPPKLGSANSWTVGWHNWNGWVTELIPIGNKKTGEGDKKLIKDDKAMIWGDYGRPDDSAAAGGSCAIRPLPRGTMQSTGGLINYIDCRAPLLELSNRVVDTVDPTNSRGLRFQDDDDARVGGHPAQRETFGTEDSSRSALRPWDCSSPPLFNASRDAGRHDGPHVRVYRPSSSPVSPTSPTTWTIPATVNATKEGYQLGADGEFTGPDGDCDTTNDRGADFYSTVGEGDFQGTDNENKIQSDWNFQFNTASRGTAPAIARPGKSGMSTDFGVEALGHGCTASGCVQSHWRATSQTVKAPATVRVDVQNIDVQPRGASYLTFYAFVGPATTSVGAQLPGGTGIYGSGQCQGATTGVLLGWNCDPNAWYINPDGSKQTEDYPLARPGQPYNLRDVDCFDQVAARAGGIEVPAGVPSLLGGADCR